MCSRCCPCSRWPSPCSKHFRRVVLTRDVGSVVAAMTMDKDGAHEFVLHLRTTCGSREPCQQCLAILSLMGAVLPRRLSNNRCANRTFLMCTNGTIIGMCVSRVALTLRMATCPSLAPSDNRTTGKRTCKRMRNNSLQQGTTPAQEECTRWSFFQGGTPDSGGRRICVLQINVTV
jgi:hypothetical protein